MNLVGHALLRIHNNVCVSLYNYLCTIHPHLHLKKDVCTYLQTTNSCVSLFYRLKLKTLVAWMYIILFPYDLSGDYTDSSLKVSMDKMMGQITQRIVSFSTHILYSYYNTH